MPDAIEEATGAVETAQQELEEAEARRVQFRNRIDALEDRAAQAKDEVREAHAEGRDLDELEAIRRKRRRATAEARDLREELDVLDGVVEEKRQALREAEMDLAELRMKALQEEAEATASEIREHGAAIADAVERMEALENTRRGLESVFRDREHDGVGTRYHRDPPVKVTIWPKPFGGKQRTLRQFTREMSRILD